MPRIPSSVMTLLQIAGRHGCPPDVCLAGTGLKPADVIRGAFLADTGDELTIVRNLVRLIGDRPGLGTEAGTPAGVGSSGVWGFALLQCRTMRHAIDLGLRFGYHKFSWELVPASVIPYPGVAARLGYADAASFSRAFRRWTGLTPGAAR